MRHTLGCLVMNHPGVLARVSGLFSRRGFNIESISVGTTENLDISRMTIVVEADEDTLEQITKQLHKLIDVIKVSDITAEEAVNRELALIKVNVDASNRSEVLQIVNIFRGSIVDVSKRTVIVEVTGDEKKIDALLELMRPYGIREFTRTGKIAMVRGDKRGGKHAEKAENCRPVMGARIPKPGKSAPSGT